MHAEENEDLIIADAKRAFGKRLISIRTGLPIKKGGRRPAPWKEEARKAREQRLSSQAVANDSLSAAASTRSNDDLLRLSDSAMQTVADRDYVASAMEYARAVCDGSIDVCKLVRAACKRQLDDLVRLSNHAVFYFDERAANRVCRFIEGLPHVKGPKAAMGEKISLEPWQCFILTTVFGWKRKDTNGRRFRRVYIEVPRGNAKSTLSSAVGLFCMSADGEFGAEVYSAATTREQAKIVFGDAQVMMRRAGGYREALGIAVSTSVTGHILAQPSSNSSFAPLTREAGTMDGKNVHCAIIDELHAHKTRDVYDVIETASAKRFSSLIWMISTAGSDTSGICYEVRNYCLKILEGHCEDDSQFSIIYTTDEGDDWLDPKVWAKANPNWGISVLADAFEGLAAKAKQTPAAQSNFKTKHLNQWVNADMAWMSMEAWDQCADPSLTEDHFRKEACFIGLDLASKTDIACKAKLFVRDIEGVRHYYCFLSSYLPEAAITDGRNASYSGWTIEDRLISTPGNVLDFAVLKEGLLADRNAYRVCECAFDPWQATQLSQEMMAEGMPMVEVRATVANFSAPMKELDALVRSGRFHHDGNPVLRWMVNNVVCHTDAKENIYPRKERPENKIDGVIAAIMALARAMTHVEIKAAYSSFAGFRSL